MPITKIAAVAICASFFAVLLREKNPASATGVALACTALLTVLILPSLKTLYSSFLRLSESGGIDGEYCKNIIKIIGAAYFTEITAGLCRDAGESAIAAKLELCGRVCVLLLTLPAIEDLCGTIYGMPALL